MADFSIFQSIQSTEVSELAEDVREIFEELSATLHSEPRTYAVETRPPLDVLETDEDVQVVMDMAGVPPNAVRVLFRSGVLLIAGEKARTMPRGPQTYHLIEREFGRFARGVRLKGSFDIQLAHATIRNGELVIVLPKLSDRRERAFRIPITADTDSPA